jgi:hypothetical protein
MTTSRRVARQTKNPSDKEAKSDVGGKNKKERNCDEEFNDQIHEPT